MGQNFCANLLKLLIFRPDVLFDCHLGDCLDSVKFLGVKFAICINVIFVCTLFFLLCSVNISNLEQEFGQVSCLGLIFGDVCIWMESKDLWHFFDRHVFDLINVLKVVIITLRELVKIANLFILAVCIVWLDDFLG